MLDERIKQKTQIYERYQKAFAAVSAIHMQPYLENTLPNHWLSSILLSDDCQVTPMQMIEALEKENIEARPIWNPMHLQPVFKEYDFVSAREERQHS